MTHSETIAAPARRVIVGTAGHIDHGKTALVKALTGIDADRLDEEKRRGITIDLGFAHLELRGPAGETLRLGFVDVPGHERFVRNMLAGAGGIDLVLMVVAADEGIKPQTREHFEICRLLGVRAGIVVLTKTDLVDQESLAVVRAEVEEFTRGSFLESKRLDPKSASKPAPIVPVSSKSGAGLDSLRAALAQMAAALSERDASAYLRLPIDRVFSMKGFGTVITGTLISGSVTNEAQVEILPQKRMARVRGVQVHGARVARAQAGERTALNLASVSPAELQRGNVLASPDRLEPVRAADVELSLLLSAKPLRDHARVHLHVYAAETIATVTIHGATGLAPGKQAFARLRFADALALVPGDRFIIRQFSPLATIGGGRVLDAFPLPRAHVEAFLDGLAHGAPKEILAARVLRRDALGLSVEDAIRETGWNETEIEHHAAELERAGELVRAADLLITRSALEKLLAAILARVDEFHRAQPLTPGTNREELRARLGKRLPPEIFSLAMGKLAEQQKIELSGELIRAAGRAIAMTAQEVESSRTIEQAFRAAGLKVPALKEILGGLRIEPARAQRLVTLLLRDKVLVKISDDLLFHRQALEALRAALAGYRSRSAKIDVAAFKQLTGVSRKYAIPLLEYLDRERITRRVGDERIIL